MPINTKKKASVILKDSNGDFFQAMPETKAEYVSYGNADTATELTRQANYDVSEATTEVETHSETTIQHVQPNGTISASNDEIGYNLAPLTLYAEFLDTQDDSLWFSINVIGKQNNPNLLEDFYDENNVTLINSSAYYDSDNSIIHIPSNQHYYCDFSIENLNFVPDAIFMSIDNCSFIEDESDDVIKNSILVAGNNIISSSTYTGYAEASDNIGTPVVQFSLPAIGESTTYYFNAVTDLRDSTYTYEPLERLDKSITIQNIDGTNCRIDFYWNTTRDVETVETTKLFKTTITREDNTETVARTAISGLLQNIDASYEETIEQVSNVPTSNRYRYMITIGDSEGTILESN